MMPHAAWFPHKYEEAWYSWSETPRLYPSTMPSLPPLLSTADARSTRAWLPFVFVFAHTRRQLSQTSQEDEARPGRVSMQPQDGPNRSSPVQARGGVNEGEAITAKRTQGRARLFLVQRSNGG